MDCQTESNNIIIDKHEDMKSNTNTTVFQNVFDLWQEVKDKLTLPLLTSICEQAGLPLPASFLIIPTEVKHKILELLPAISLARIGCVCLELKFLAGSDNLWKLRFTYEFGCQIESIKVKAPGQWKNIFAREWCHQKRCLHHTKEVEQYLNNSCYNDRSGESTFPMLLTPQLSPFPPHIIPTMIGGNYDQFPSLNSNNMGAMLYQPRARSDLTFSNARCSSCCRKNIAGIIDLGTRVSSSLSSLPNHVPSNVGLGLDLTELHRTHGISELEYSPLMHSMMMIDNKDTNFLPLSPSGIAIFKLEPPRNE
jgi:hypothetical protein